jgi:hypothetical protein
VVTINFINKLPKKVKQHDSIMVVVDNLTKAVHFVSVNMTHIETNIAKISMKEIARLHGIPKTIFSDRDTKVYFKLLERIFKGFGINLNFSTAYHP